MKTPVLCSNIEPLTEISKIGGCLLVNPDDDNNIYLGLKKLIEDNTYLSKLKNEINSEKLINCDTYAQKFISKIFNTKKVYFYKFVPTNMLKQICSSCIDNLNLSAGSWIVINQLYNDEFYNECKEKYINIIFYKDDNSNVDPSLLKYTHNVNLIYVKNKDDKDNIIHHLNFYMRKLNNINEKIYIFDNNQHNILLKENDLYKNIYNHIPMINEYKQPTDILLSICVSTYNREKWIEYTTTKICEQIQSFENKHLIEFVVVDNKSTDNTPNILKKLQNKYKFKYFINQHNVGMLPNLSITSQKTEGKYIWILGDDDIIKDGAINNVMQVLMNNSNINLVYLNYIASRAINTDDILTAEIVKPTTDNIIHNDGIYKINEMALFNENLFTAIYCIIFRRDHGLLAYNQNINNDIEFKNLVNCVPSTVYVIKNMMNYNAYWISDYQLTVNLNCSWANNGKDILWHLKLRPDMFDLAEKYFLYGDLNKLDSYRKCHINNEYILNIEKYKKKYKILEYFDNTNYSKQIKQISESTFSLCTKKIKEITKVSIILILHNNLHWFDYFENQINIMREKYNFDFDFYIYENNSNIEFKERLKNFMVNSKGKFLSETNKSTKFDSIISKERGIYMNDIRNKNKLNHGCLNSEYSWLVDSDVYFNDDILVKYIDNLKNNSSLCAISSLCLTKEVGLENHNYDTLAFSNEKYNYVNTGNTCLMKNCIRCKNHRKNVNIFIPEKDLIVPGNIIYPNCAFNSNTLIHTEIYNKVKWTSEYGLEETDWFGFFRNLRYYGKIAMDTKIISYKCK